MSVVAFSIPGQVRGKGRPRFGNGRTYTDAKTASYEALVGWYAAQAMQGRAPFAGPLALVITARIEPPASASKTARAEMLAGRQAPAKRPDLDNIIKAVLDGCNAVAFRDDAQVVALTAAKAYGLIAGVDVLLQPAVPA